MKHGHAEGHKGEYGGGLVEFCFVMPVLLLIAGATVDLSRYMRYLQVTTFVSQETASQIYRQCSDITIYDRPELSTTGLTTGLQINGVLTQQAVQSCVGRVQAAAQQILDTSLGRASVSSKVFRWNIANPSVSNCTTVGAMGNNVTEISAPARLTAGVRILSDGIYQTLNGSFKGNRRLATPFVLCQKGRIATVEVGYAFQPTLLFLMTGLDTNGTQRETTVL